MKRAGCRGWNQHNKNCHRQKKVGVQLEARYTLPDGRTVTLLQVPLRNANDELAIVSFFPLPRSNQGTEISRLIYYRRK